MTDITPATGSVIGVAAGVVLEILGIDVPPLVWAIVGAALMQGYSEVNVSRGKAAVQIVASSMLGAIIGLSAAKYSGISHQHTVYLLCAIGGFGAHPLMQSFLARFTKKVEELPK